MNIEPANPQAEEKELEEFLKKRAQNNRIEDLDIAHKHHKRKIFDVEAVYREKDYNPQNSNYVGPMKPKIYEGDKAELSSSEEEEEFREQLSYYKELDFRSIGIPISHSVQFQGHTKSLTAVTFDRAYSRMVTGGNDYKVKLWDFHNMDQRRMSFRTLEPIKGQPPKALEYNSAGNKLLICGGNAKPKILNRDGREELEFVKGDMYISDYNHTRGHVGIVSSGKWHPTDENIMVTSSLDSTVRIWDVNQKLIGIEQQLPSKQVIKCKTSKGTKTGVYQAEISQDGSFILASCEDGSLQTFSGKNRYLRPQQVYRSPYKLEMTDMKVFRDNHRILTRNQDNTMRLYDLRRFDRPVYSWYELDNNHSHTQICISPNEEFILTGTSNTKTTPGCLYIFKAKDYEEVSRIPLVAGKVTVMKWIEELNQIFVGVGTSLVSFYDPTMSQKGAIPSITKKIRKWMPEDFEYQRPVMTPHALPLFNQDSKHKRHSLETIRNDAKLSSRPEMPLTGPGRGGKVAGATTITQHLMRNVHRIDDDKREDPVEALLRYKKEAEDNPEFVDNAYKVTQPIKLLDYKSTEHEEQLLMRQHRKCPKCGLKICQCVKKKF